MCGAPDVSSARGGNATSGSRLRSRSAGRSCSRSKLSHTVGASSVLPANWKRDERSHACLLFRFCMARRNTVVSRRACCGSISRIRDGVGQLHERDLHRVQIFEQRQSEHRRLLARTRLARPSCGGQSAAGESDSNRDGATASPGIALRWLRMWWQVRDGMNVWLLLRGRVLALRFSLFASDGSGEERMAISK